MMTRLARKFSVWDPLGSSLPFGGKSKNARCIGFFVFLIVLNLAFPEICGAEENSGGAAPEVGTINVLDVVKKTMEHQSAIQIQREQVNLARGAYRSSGGDFDWRVEPSFNLRRDYAPIQGADAIIERENLSEGSLRFSKLLRSGVSVEPFVQYTESDYRLTDQKLSPSKAGTIGLQFEVPLLRGLGYQNAGVGEIAASLELEATQLSLAHEISSSVHDAVQAFWAYLAAHERLAVLTQAEERARTILKKTETLVQADELPAAELVNIRANLADKGSSRFAAAQAVVAAQAGLGMAMGIPSAEIYNLPPPSEPFPALDQTTLRRAMAADGAAYASIAADHRMDLLAMGKQNESLKAQLRAARNRVKPALNLELSLGYDGLKSGSGLSRSLQTIEYHQDAPDWTTGIRLIYPLGNNGSEGELEQALARYHQGQEREQELFRSINANIGLTRSDLSNIFQQLERSEEAVRNYRTAVDNEREKYMMGETTLLDLLYIEDRLDGALLNHIALQQQAADGLARLRYETGKLVRFKGEEAMITSGDLTTLLVPEGGKTP